MWFTLLLESYRENCSISIPEQLAMLLCNGKSTLETWDWISQMLGPSFTGSALLVSPRGAGRSPGKCHHPAGSGATEHSGGRRERRLCIRHALKFPLSHSHSPLAAEAFLTQQWPTGRHTQRSKAFLWSVALQQIALRRSGQSFVL